MPFTTPPTEHFDVIVVGGVEKAIVRFSIGQVQAGARPAFGSVEVDGFPELAMSWRSRSQEAPFLAASPQEAPLKSYQAVSSW